MALGANLKEPDWMKQQREAFLAYPWMKAVFADEPDLLKYATDPMGSTIEILKQNAPNAFKELL